MNVSKLIIPVVVLAVSLSSLAIPARAFEGVGDLQLWSDYAAFRMMPGSPNGYVEFYLELKRVDFAFQRVGEIIAADVFTWVHVSDSNGRPVDSVGGSFGDIVTDSAALRDSNYTVFFARALELKPGAYRARVVVVDLGDKASSEVSYPFRVPDFSRDGLAFSDIQLGYDIVRIASDSVERPLDVLVKNQYKVFPDCRALVSPMRPRLHFYIEAYNLSYDEAVDKSYNVEFSIVPTDGSAARPLGPQTLTKPGSSAVLASSISVRDLPSGLYRFRAEATDPLTTQKAAVEKSFQVVSAVRDTLLPEEIEQIRNIIAYIARPGEIEVFENLNAVGKVNFMQQFWKDRDPTPDTPANEFRDEHLRRMNFANDRFSVGFRDRTDGWRADQGRVYIVYGPPDQIDRYPFTSGREAAERWTFESLPTQGTAYFLFVDKNGYGDYRLVHSTARGEKRDPVWEQRVQSGEFERDR